MNQGTSTDRADEKPANYRDAITELDDDNERLQPSDHYHYDWCDGSAPSKLSTSHLRPEPVIVVGAGMRDHEPSNAPEP